MARRPSFIHDNSTIQIQRPIEIYERKKTKTSSSSFFDFLSHQQDGRMNEDWWRRLYAQREKDTGIYII